MKENDGAMVRPSTATGRARGTGGGSSGGKDRRHLAQVECARQRYDLDRFSLLPVSWCLLGDRVIS